MSKHDESRRKFLVGAAVGAGAVATGGLPADALAQAQAAAVTPAAVTPAAATAHDHERAAEGALRAFFNQDDATTIEAFAERLMPGAPGKPGARDANVINYIDLALAGAYADQQDFYRRGLAALDQYCRVTYNKPFVELIPAQQDEVITALEAGKAAGFTYPSAATFFNTIRTHTIEGMFADPVYGGNKDFAGWRLVGFPGAQPMFTTADMRSREAFTRSPMAGLQAKAAR